MDSDNVLVLLMRRDMDKGSLMHLTTDYDRTQFDLSIECDLPVQINGTKCVIVYSDCIKVDNEIVYEFINNES